MQRQAYTCEREAITKSGFPVTLPVWCGWEFRPRENKPKPDKVKDVHEQPGSDEWRPMDRVAAHGQGDMLGLNIYESWLTCLDADERHPVYKNLIKALPVWELSVSGTGTHLFTRATVPEDCPQHWYKDGHKLEVYGRNAKGRFIALTGKFLNGKTELEDVLDTPPDLVALLVADGWAPGAAVAKAGPVEMPAELPPAPKLGRLDEWAAMLDARHKDDPERGNGPWGAMSPAKQSRWSAMGILMDRAAVLVASPAELASWWYASFPGLIGARGGGPDHAADRDREVSRAWASRPEMPDVPRETLAADFGDALPEERPVNTDAADRIDRDTGDDDGGGLEREGPETPFISHVDVARHYVEELRITGSDVVFDETNGHSYFLDPASGTWILDEMGTLGYEVLAHMQNIWRRRADQVPEDNAEMMAAVRKLRRELGNMNFHREVCRAVNNLAKVHYSQLDKNPYLIGTPEGVIDPRHGTVVRKGSAGEYVTQRTRVSPDFSRRPVNFLNFLSSMFPDEPEIIEFLQRWFGYCLTGSNKEQVMLFCYGQGSNGKSTLVRVFSGIMGTYHRPVKSEIFMASKFERHDTEKAQLRGKRLITATEINKGAAWNEAWLKQLTGGDMINARYVYRDMMEFENTAKIMITGNDKPRLSSFDLAMKRRILLLEFAKQFVGGEKIDGLDEILADEAPAILAWALRGAVAWHDAAREGLRVPEKVLAATQQYFVDEDLVKTWLETCTYTESSIDKCAAITDALASYNEWIRTISPSSLAASITEFKAGLERNNITLKKRSAVRLAGCAILDEHKPRQKRIDDAMRLKYGVVSADLPSSTDTDYGDLGPDADQDKGGGKLN